MIKTKKLSDQAIDALNNILKNEYYAFYLYRHIGNYLKNWGFDVAAAFFYDESSEELTHAKKIEDYIVMWNGEPKLPQIKIECDCQNILECIETAYDTEFKLLEIIEDESVRLLERGEANVYDFLQFFRGVQTESVGMYSDMLNMLDLVDIKDKASLILLQDKIFK